MRRVVIRHCTPWTGCLLLALMLPICVTRTTAQSTAITETRPFGACDIEAYPDFFTDWHSAHPHYTGTMVPLLVDSVDVPPQPGRISNYITSPETPDDVDGDDWVAWALFEIVVEPDGSVYFVEPLNAHAWRNTEQPTRPRTPETQRAAQAFVAAGIMMLKSATYSPGQRNGEAVATIMCVPIRWSKS